MDSEARQKLRDKMSDVDRAEEGFTQSFVSEHIALYFAATEEEREAAGVQIARAENGPDDILSDPRIPGGQWRHKWPAQARKAVAALWRSRRGE